MNEQQVYDHIKNHVDTQVSAMSPRMGIVSIIMAVLGGNVVTVLPVIGKIIDAVKLLVNQSGITKEIVLAAAKKYYLEYTAGNNPNLPDVIETWVEAAGWMAIDWAINRLFSVPAPVVP